jgi:transposase
MNVIYPRCCGLDVHAKTIVACRILCGKKTTRTFSTMTDAILELADWLASGRCTHVAMESTGVYWKPVFTILEGLFEVVLVNPRHYKNVPGRKTDVKDSEWLADLLRHGMLKASFIPPAHIRDLRELTRHRSTMVRERSAVANRVQKLAESGNVKLGQVLSDALGVSGRRMLRALAEGQTDPQRLGGLADRQLAPKSDELRRAVAGRLTSAQRFVLGQLLDEYDRLEQAIVRVTERIAQEVGRADPDPFVAEAVSVLQTIPGVGPRGAEVIVSEIGTDMSRFPSADHLASWAGMCPGNNESGGKRRSGRTRKGNRALKAALVQAAWAASRARATGLANRFRWLAAHRGKKRAAVAIGHDILVAAYYMLSRRESYHAVGGRAYDERSVERLQQHLIRRLEATGLAVTVEPVSDAA